MNKLKPHSLLFIPILLLGFLSTAQTKDNIVWASMKVKKKIDQQTSFAIAPFVRINENISSYQNMSIDISLKRKLGNRWFVQALSRTWFIPNAKGRQFLWLDIGWSKTGTKIGLDSAVRYHYALDIYEQNDPDFLRWKTVFTLFRMRKIKPFIAIEPWFRLNHLNQFQHIRYEPGIKWAIKQSLELLLMYRRQETINKKPEVNFNMYIIGLGYSLPQKTM